MANEESASQEGNRSLPGIWGIVGGLALAAVAYAVIANLHDIKRYIRITRM